jgi:hypothetical protein
MNNKAQADRQQRQSFEGFSNSNDENFNFDLWAVAVRQQMLAALKKREGHRVNWD